MRQRHDDSRSAGRSSIAPYLPGEPAQQRHERRKRAAQENESQLRAALESIGYTLAISNEGQHWAMRCKRNGDLWEWWPSTAKLVHGKQWARGVHCHDWQQVMREIGRSIKREES